MIRIFAFVLFLILFSGCSTVEKRGYFTPTVGPVFTTGPKKLPCGFANFGGQPDQYVSPLGDYKVSITAYQYYDPYLWGPWFISVVPVFPITWIVDIFTDNDLRIAVAVSKELNETPNTDSFSITYTKDGEEKTLKPSSIDIEYATIYITFPIDASKFDTMVFHMEGFEEPIHIPFSKTYRWSWTQWTPNC